MPDNKQQPNQSLQNDPQYENYIKYLNEERKGFEGKTTFQVFNDQAELYYYAQKLNKALRQKDPSNYDRLIDEFGEDSGVPLVKRSEGAKMYINKTDGRNFSYSLTPIEQKNVLGKDWDRFVQLRQTYGKAMNYVGENEDISKPETWQVGARHAVMTYPSKREWTRYDSKGNLEANYFTEVKYDPTQKNPYVSKVKRLSRVVHSYDNNNQEKTENGVVFKTPGPHFYKEYDDGTRDEISKEQWLSMRNFNNASPEERQKIIAQDMY